MTGSASLWKHPVSLWSHPVSLWSHTVSLWKKLNVYDLIIIVLLIQFAANILYLNPLNNIVHLLTAVLSAVLLDFVIDLARFKSRQFPKSGLISGLIIGLLIEPGSLSFGIPMVTIVAVIAILSKQFIRFRARHIFNPANFGLLVALTILPGAGGAISWWGSAGTLYSAGLSSLFLILPLGLLVNLKLKRLSISIPFLLLASAFSMSLAGANTTTILFFALIMLVEPVTSVQAKHKGKVLYASIAAVSLTALNMFSPAYALHTSLFIANLLGFVGVLLVKSRQAKKVAAPESAQITTPKNKK